MCDGNINLKNDDDLFFAISNTILSFEKESFTVNDIISRIEENYPEMKGNQRVPRFTQEIINRFINSGKIIEEPRTYRKLEQTDTED